MPCWVPAAPIQARTGISTSTIVSIDSMPVRCWGQRCVEIVHFCTHRQPSSTRRRDMLYAYYVPHAHTQHVKPDCACLPTVTLSRCPPPPPGLQATQPQWLSHSLFRHHPRTTTNNGNRFCALPVDRRRLPSIDRLPRTTASFSKIAMVYLGMIRILPIPPTSEFCIAIPMALVRFPLRADRDLTWTHHALPLSLSLSDPWSRPCTGNIVHPLHGKHHGAAELSPLQSTSSMFYRARGLGWPSWASG